MDCLFQSDWIGLFLLISVLVIGEIVGLAVVIVKERPQDKKATEIIGCSKLRSEWLPEPNII